MVGPENPNTTSGLRNLIDTTLLLTPPGKFNAYINFDYGQNQDATYAATGRPLRRQLLHDWWGVAGAVHVQASAKNAIAFAVEYFDDAQTASRPALSQHICMKAPSPMSTSGSKAC